jgi:uncharacterized delta-60 repeat protein
MRKTILFSAAVLLSITVGAPVASAPADRGVVSLAAAGDLDPTFGGDGLVRTSFGRRDAVAHAAAIQTDGKIVVCGRAGRGVFALARYDADGMLDTTFGEDGKVSSPRSDAGGCYAVAIQADRKIVAGGGVLVRYSTDGTLDTSFGEDGIVAAPAGALAIQADGKIVVGGGALARYNSDGTLDSTFGDGGVADVPADAVAIQADGKIVVSDTGDETLSRVNGDGTLDDTFGTDGTVSTDLFTTGGWVNAIAIQPDGKIVAAGGGLDCEGGCDLLFALFRFNADGTLDTTFGSSGVIGYTTQEAYDVTIQSDGKIVAAGVAGPYDTSSSWFAIQRHNTDGAADTTFGGDGRVYTGFTRPASAYANAVAIQADGKIVAVGRATWHQGWKFALARYLGG